MQFNLQMESGSEQATGSDDRQFGLGLRRMVKEEIQVMVIPTVQQLMGPIMEDLIMKKRIEVMVIRTVEQVIVPIMEDLIRKVVQEEIQSAQEKFLTGDKRLENETTVSKERGLSLKFLGEVSPHVLTGKMIKGKEGTPIRVALYDNITGQVVDCGPESSSKVEILVLEAKDDDNEDNWSGEDFNNRIIREGDKKKPHFAKSNYIYLKEGIGTLCNTKLGHDSTWTKSCKCRLGARMESFGGVRVQEAWTESFMVSDSRSKLNKKHYPPSLSDPVWRLEKIGKDGAPCKRLEERKICTVRDFLFLHYINPPMLKKIVGAKIWKATLDHAQTCIVDDKRMYLYYPLPEPRKGAVFDVVGGLKGAIHDSYYVPNDNLSEADQEGARKLLRSAFEYPKNIIHFDNENASGNENNIITFDNESALLQQFPYRPCSINAPTNSVIPQGPCDNDLPCSERINGYDHTEPDTSSQIVQSSITPSDRPNMGQLDDPIWSPSYDTLIGNFGDYTLIGNFGDYNLMSPFSSETNNISQTLMADSHSHQQSNVSNIQLSLMLWRFRARRRVMALGGIHVQKRQRT